MLQKACNRTGQPAGYEFDEFAFASLVNNCGQTSLSVMSALAKLDIDVWQEAAELAQLPRPIASQRLERLIATVSNQESVRLDAQAASARLVALLPYYTQAHGIETNDDTQDDPADNPGPLITALCAAVGIVVLLLVLLTFQFVSISAAVTGQ